MNERTAGATEGAWGKNKYRKNESLMEPKAGTQGDNLNVHYSKIRSWSSLRLITEFAECSSFIVICNSPSPQATRASGKTEEFGSIPRSFWLCLPTLSTLSSLRPALLCRGGLDEWGKSLPGSFSGALCVCVAATASGPCSLSQALSGTFYFLPPLLTHHCGSPCSYLCPPRIWSDEPCTAPLP